MPSSLRRALFLVALLAGSLGVAAPALAADQPFSVRFAQTVRGSINAVGNQLLTCPAAAAGCAAARDRSGPTATMNNNYNMEYVDVDGDAGTVNSSTSTLALPTGATVVWAGLYWGADTAIGTGGSAAPDALNRGTVRFKVGSGSYQTVTAAPADVLTSTGRASRYRAFANVTSLLPAAGNGTYTVADVQTGRGDDRFAGWSLVVAYEDPTEGFHRVSVYDGLGTVDATHTFSTDITPFYTPASGAVATKTGLLAFEGDAGIIGETATFNGTALTDAINGPGNLMNSTMAVDGTLFTAKNPNYANLQGTDIDVWNSTGLLGNHQSTATLSFASNQDLFVPSALWLVSDEGPASNTAGPTVGGLARDGSTLTANPGSWAGTPTITYDYQWQRCADDGTACVDIPGATAATYTLTPADVGSTVRVLVTAVNDAGPSTPASSAPTSTIAQLAPSNVVLPVLSGTEQDGQTLTTTIGGWNGTAPLNYDVQWQRCADDGTACADIAGATAWSYVLTAVDIGSTVRSEVTASNAAGSAPAVSAPTSTVDPAPPANTIAPTVGGVVRDGHTLTAGDGTWTGTPTIAYARQWQSCADDGTACADIAGATGSTYLLTAADIGHAIRVEVTGTNVAGNDVAFSSPTLAVVADPPTNTVVPTLSGTPRDGQTLTLDDGTWTGTDPIDYDYVWQRCDAAGANCAAIAGETGTTYTLTANDVDATIRALVTASNSAGVTAEQTAPTVVIAADPPVNTTPPSTTGTAVDGATLTAGDGTWSGTDPVLYTYQWQRCADDGTACADITDETDPTYTLTGDDIGLTVRVVVTAANDAGSAPAASPATGAVAADPPANVAVPTTSGTVRDGEVLTAAPGTWTGTDPIDYDYQWERCDADGDNCQPIVGATDPTYTLEDADAGQTVRVVVTGTNGAGFDTATSAPTTVVDGVAPANAALPTISGTLADGDTLTLDDGDWTGTTPLTATYQWQRCDADGVGCADITGATALAYTLQSADVDGTVRAIVTVTNDYGVASEATDPSGVVDATPPSVTVDPTVLGTAVDGETVTADPGIWAGTAPVTFTYQWLRCDVDGTDCAAIPGATGVDYELVDEDAGHGIRVEVTATNDAGSATGTSPVAAVDAAAPQNDTPPTISGTFADGETLTVDEGTWLGTHPLDYDYEWLRCDADGSGCVTIPAETGSTYTLTADDVGHEVRVVVVATNAAGSAPAASDATGTAVEADPPISVVPPLVSGLLEDGATLAAGTGGWSGTEPIAFTYQWLLCDAGGSSCSQIAGATNDTYTLTSSDVGGSVRVRVTGTNAAGDDVGISAPGDAIAATPPVSTTPPAISGATVDGQTLSADHGAFSGTAPMAYAYQWQRCDADGTNCNDISGANGTTYALQPADVGSAIVVVVTASNGGGADTATSSATTEVLALAPVNTDVPTISGDPLDGETLTADPGTWTGTPTITYAYQWQRCDENGDNCVDILGAADPTYTLVPGDIDHVLTVVVTATNAGGSVPSASAPTATAEAAPPVNSVVPTVAGTLEDGETLTADPGTWSGTDPVAYGYQWQRCADDGTACADIAGATGSTHVLAAADVGHAIVVAVTATNIAGNDVATSVPTSGVAVDPPATSGTPEATGTPVDGQTLTADPGTWTGTGPIDFTYQWLRCADDGTACVDIAGATDDTYTLGTDDLGSTVRVEVTGDNGEQTTVASPFVGPVAPLAPTSTSVPTVSGSVGFGDTLTAGDGTWDGSEPLSFTHQWLRCDENGDTCAVIAGATGSTYDLTAADVGHAIRVEVTGTNVAGDDSAVSAPTTPALPAPPVNTGQPGAPSGTAVDGGTLTADPGTWTGDLPIDYDYQWQRCDADGTDCVDIAGATGETYSPTGGDIGHAIVVVVTVTNPGGPSSEASAPTAPVLAAPPVNTFPPTITGTPEDGGTLTADPGTWTGTTPIDFSYQWQRCEADGTCVDIAGATDASYAPGADDVGHGITVVVTGDNAGGEDTAVAATTAAVVASPPRDTTPPVITGGVDVGDVLTADEGTWTGTAPVTYTHQWQRCDEDGANCVDIAGATDSTYTIVEADQGHAVVVVVTATNAVDSDTSASDPVVVPAPPVNTGAPSISGDPEVGETLTADAGTWTGTGPIAHTYQWQRCDFFGADCVVIVGATGDTYVLTDEDLGHTIQIVVGASNAAGSAEADAPVTAAVDNPAPEPTPTSTPTPTPTPTATPTPTPTATPAPKRPLSGSPGVTSGPVASDSAFAPGALGGADLGNVPGSLVGDASCQQLAGNSKYRRVKAKGIGTVRVRAYATGPATRVSPVLVTTQISGGKAKKVSYKLDGRKLKAKRGKTWKSAITPAKLQNVGIHTLKATIKGRRKGAKTKVVTLTLKTVPCRTLFTAQRWRTTAGAGLRLRIDARTAMQRVTFTVAAPLLPRQIKKARTIGFMRVFVAGERGRRRFSLKLAKKGGKKPLVSGAGKPTVRLRKGKIVVSGLPAGAAVTELTLYRETKLDGTTKRRVFKLRARVAPTGGTLSVRPKVQR